MTHTLPAPPPPNRLGNETLRQTPFYQPGPPERRSKETSDDSHRLAADTERRKPRNLEPNLGDVPAEIVRSPQSGAKLLSQAFAPARARGCPAGCAKQKQGAPRCPATPCACVRPILNPPQPRSGACWHRFDREGAIRPTSCSKPRRGTQTGLGRRDAPSPSGFKIQKTWGAAWCFRGIGGWVRNLGNVEIAVFEQQKHGHRWGAMLSPAPAGRACHRSSRATCRQLTSYLPASQLTSYLPAAHELLPSSSRATCQTPFRTAYRTAFRATYRTSFRAAPGPRSLAGFDPRQARDSELVCLAHQPKFQDSSPKISRLHTENFGHYGLLPKQLRSTTACIQTAPEHDGALPNSSPVLRAQEDCFRRSARPVCKHFRAPKITNPTASSPQNVSKLASQLLQSGELEHPPQRERKVLFHPFHVVLLRALISSPVLVSKSFHFSTLSMLAFWAPPTPCRKPRKSWKWWKRPARHIGVAVFCRPSVRPSVCPWARRAAGPKLWVSFGLITAVDGPASGGGA